MFLFYCFNSGWENEQVEMSKFEAEKCPEFGRYNFWLAPFSLESK